MQDLPKPVWELLAQKIDDPKTWLSFSQVSRLTRFLTQKYKRMKQQEFSKFGKIINIKGNNHYTTYAKMILPNGKIHPDSDYLMIRFDGDINYHFANLYPVDMIDNMAWYHFNINGIKYMVCLDLPQAVTSHLQSVKSFAELEKHLNYSSRFVWYIKVIYDEFNLQIYRNGITGIPACILEYHNL